jgi:hypothetical protein
VDPLHNRLVLDLVVAVAAVFGQVDKHRNISSKGRGSRRVLFRCKKVAG